MLVRSDDGTIDPVDGPIDTARRLGLLRHRLQETLEEPRPPPAVEPAGHGPPRPIPFRQSPPGGASTQEPEDAVQDGAVVMGRSPNRGFLGREQGLEPLPWLVRQIASVHTLEYTEESRICKQTLVPKGGLEPPRVAPPPPQDGVSTKFHHFGLKWNPRHSANDSNCRLL
jgi:hypothetical protein